jgi:zinc transport system substrate-binding protein
VARVASAFERADPPGTAAYRQGARDFTAELIALDISFRSSLANCARHDIVTSYPTFGRLAARYGLADHAIADLPPTAGAPAGQLAAGPPAAGPPPGRLAGLARLIHAKGLSTLFDDPLTPLPAAGSLARQSHVKVQPLDPIAGLTGPEQARHATYLSRMADDLAALRAALACDTSD